MKYELFVLKLMDNLVLWWGVLWVEAWFLWRFVSLGLFLALEQLREVFSTVFAENQELKPKREYLLYTCKL